MKVEELRSCLRGYDRPTLEALLVELYKAMPKALKEEKLIDPYIRAATAGKPVAPSKPVRRDIDQIASDVEQFIEYARNQYYLAPNSHVRKADRPKWRFVAKRLYKELLSADGEDLGRATVLLIDLYKLFCLACTEYLFSTDEPFQSMGVEQDEFLTTTVARVFSGGYSQQSVNKALDLLFQRGVAVNMTHTALMHAVLPLFPTVDVREMALKELRGVRDPYGDGPAMFSLLLYIRMGEPQAGIDYFNEHSTERQAEVRLYILLRSLRTLKRSDLWLTAYDAAVAKGVSPRRELQAEYSRILASNQPQTVVTAQPMSQEERVGGAFGDPGTTSGIDNHGPAC